MLSLLKFRHLLALTLSTLILPLSAEKLLAEVSLQQAFLACEASLIQGSSAPLQQIGTVIDEDARMIRLQVETHEGSLMAMHLPPHGPVSACLLWGREPNLEVEFQSQWKDWVEWEEAIAASKTWFDNAMDIAGSVDLTNQALPGIVVAHGESGENGVVMTSEPKVTNVIRQILPPTNEPALEPVVFFQFSAYEANPERCNAALEAQQRTD